MEKLGDDGFSEMRILHIAPSFFPATRWGGPIFSTKAICDWIFENRAVELRVITTDAAGPDRGDRLELERRRNRMSAGYQVEYFPRIAGHSISPALLLALPRAILWADVVHITATYSFTTLPSLAVTKLLNRPVVWSPRGGVQAAADWEDAPNLRKKRIFEKVAAALTPRLAVVHVTAETERAAMAPRFPNASFASIPNSVELPPMCARPARGSHEIRLMFLSRVHEKKGLTLLLDILAGLPSEFSLSVYGSGEPSYLSDLKAKADFLGIRDRISFHGHVDGTAKYDAFSQADLFVLPSYSENFGIVVAEALASGLPVVTTDRTPWSGLDSKGCGRCVSPTVEALREAILALGAEDLYEMGVRGRAWMEAEFSPGSVHSSMFDVYEALCSAKLSGEPLDLNLQSNWKR